MQSTNRTLAPPSLLRNSSTSGFNWAFRIRGHAGSVQTATAGTAGQFRRSEKMARLEAALIVADDALAARRLAHVATLADATEARTLIRQLNEIYDASGTAFRVERVAAGYQLLTRPEFAFWLGKLHHRQAELKLSSPAMETLAIVAYRQPVVRADIEAIRGVQSTEMLKQLMERGLVRIAGNDDSLGRPFLYGTTRKFLELFGLQNLEDLPMSDRLRPQETSAEDIDAESDESAEDGCEEPEVAGSVHVDEEETDDGEDVRRIA